MLPAPRRCSAAGDNTTVCQSPKASASVIATESPERCPSSSLAALVRNGRPARHSAPRPDETPNQTSDIPFAAVYSSHGSSYSRTPLTQEDEDQSDSGGGDGVGRRRHGTWWWRWRRRRWGAVAAAAGAPALSAAAAARGGATTTRITAATSTGGRDTLVAVDEPHAAVAGVGNMATQ